MYVREKWLCSYDNFDLTRYYGSIFVYECEIVNIVVKKYVDRYEDYEEPKKYLCFCLECKYLCDNRGVRKEMKDNSKGCIETYKDEIDICIEDACFKETISEELLNAIYNGQIPDVVNVETLVSKKFIMYVSSYYCPVSSYVEWDRLKFKSIKEEITYEKN